MDGSVIHGLNVAFRETKDTDTYLTVLDEKVAQTI
jgi:hypothetical protein